MGKVLNMFGDDITPYEEDENTSEDEIQFKDFFNFMMETNTAQDVMVEAILKSFKVTLKNK